MAAGTFAPDPALPNSGFPVSIAQYDDDTKRQIVRAFAAYEMSGVDTADRIILGVVPEQLATDVERIAQIDIHGFDNVLQADGLRHGAKHDGRTGNKPVTPEDVAALLDIFDTYNNITVTSKRGETSIKLSKTGADGMTYVAVIGKKKGHIFTKNMWKGQTKGDGSFRRTDAHNAPASTPAAAANYEPSTDSLPENVQDGKGTTGFLPSTADATGRPQAQAREPMRANRADAAATPQGTAGVDVMDELVRGAGAVGAQETDGAGARAQSAMEAALAGTEEPGARPAGQGKRRYRTGVNRVDTAGRLSASDRMQLRVLDGLGKKYGVKLVIEDTIRYEDGEGRVYAGTANAYYDRSDGTIHVALDAEGGAYLFFAVHELTHKLRAENADAYAALEAFVLNKLETSELYGALTQGEGGTLEERIASVRALYAARGQELSRGEAIEEIVCDAIPVILTDEQTVRELVRTDRTLAERIRDFFEEFYNELMRQLAGVVYGPGNRVEAAALMNDAETVRELAELFKTALESSADLQYELLTQSGSAIEEAGNDKRRGRRLSARADGEDAITMEDVAAIQSIGRKSVNAFSSDEIRTAEPFARRYWRELGVKSPFFRAWFGDWRANDRMPVQLVRVAGADAPKSGRAINADTGRPISWGDRLRSETWAHGTKNALESIKGIDRIIETAVLLDTIAANQTGKSKLPGTAFMHSLYSLVDDGNGLTLYRLFAEEAVPVGGGDPFTRAYELKEIKKVATAPYGVLSVSGGLTNGAPATTYTVADLFAFVKENVPDFQPKPVHPAMLNADGTPRAVRQGVDATVEVLDGKTALQDGEAVYVKLENPYPVGTAAEVPDRAALEAGGYDGAVYQDGNGGTHYVVLDGTQLKSATDNAGTFDGRNPNLRFSQKADAGWAAYVSEEAQQRYAQDGRFQRWAHRDLAFISAASWDGVHIPADVLMQNPKIREAQELTEGRGSSLQKNLPGTNSLVDERRERLAQRLLNAEHGSAVFENGKIKKINGVEQFTGEVEQGRHACIVIGRPAGGKSRVFANPLSNRYKARILDADTVKPWLDGFDDGYGAGYVQDESSLIMEMAFEKAIARGDNVIIPKIGGGRIVDLANRMKSAGYTVDLYYNEVSEETSIMRAASRFAEEGRYLSLNYLLTIRNKPKETFTKWAESGIFDYAEWRNNDVGFGEEPRLVWRTGDGGLASVLGDAAELERTVGMGSSDAQRYRRDIPVSGGTEAGDREISGQVTGRKQIDSDTTEAPEEGAFFDALIQDTPRRYSARATTNDGAHRQSAEDRDAAPAVSEKVLGNVAKRILQRTGSGYSADRLTDGLKTLLHANAQQRRETADALARQVPIPRWQGLAVEKRTGIAYNGERKRAPCGGRGGPRGGVRGEMDACCKNRSNGWF